MVLIVVLVALILGFTIQQEILWFVLFAWAGLGASIGPTSLLALFWKKTTRQGVICGLITGTLVVFIWKTNKYLSNIIYELIPGFIFALIVTIVVSLLTGKSENE